MRKDGSGGRIARPHLIRLATSGPTLVALTALVAACSSAASTAGPPSPTPSPSVFSVPSGPFATIDLSTPTLPAFGPSEPAATSSAANGATAAGSGSPIPVPPGGGYTWRAGNAGESIAGEIVAVPNGYLATCMPSDVGFALCGSKDLLAWSSPPDPSLFVTGETGPFLLYGVERVTGGRGFGLPLGVKTGYAAESLVPFDTDTGTFTQWYSADGVRWQKGIPKEQLLLDDCPPDPSSTGCLDSQWVTANPKTGAQLAWYQESGDALGGRLLISTNRGASWSRVDEPYFHSAAGGRPAVMANGTWIAPVAWVKPLVPNQGAVITTLARSTDGKHWTQITSESDRDVGSVVAVGDVLFATFEGDAQQEEAAGDLVWDAFVSVDAGDSWTPLKDARGRPLTGRILSVVGSKIVLQDDLGAAIDWIGTPS